MSESPHDLFANDQIAEDNKWIPGYDISPEVLAQSLILQQKNHKEFLEMLDHFKSQW